MRAASAVDTEARVIGRQDQVAPLLTDGDDERAIQVSGPRPDVRSCAHSGQPCLFGYTANTYCRTKPSTNTGIADAAGGDDRGEPVAERVSSDRREQPDADADDDLDEHRPEGEAQAVDGLLAEDVVDAAAVRYDSPRSQWTTRSQ